MTQTTLEDKDGDLKLRTMRYLWHVGYMVRRNVKLSRYDGTRKDGDYTDIDVLAVGFDEMLEKSSIVCDCKTGSSASNTERILILAGLVKYLDARYGLFVRDFISEKKHSEFANKVNVRTLSQTQFDKLEASIRIDPRSFYGSFSLDQSKPNSILEALKTVAKDIYEYILVQNWDYPAHERILTLAAHADRVKSMTTLSRESKTFVLGYILSLFAIAVLEFMRETLYVKDEEKEDFIEQSLVGGRISFSEKSNLLSSFYDFMTAEIYKRYGKKYPIQKKDFVEQLIPPYSKYLIDLILRLSVDLKNAKSMPRVIDLINYEVLFKRKPSVYQLGLFDAKDIQFSVGYALDLITFASRAGLLDPETKQIFDENLKTMR